MFESFKERIFFLPFNEFLTDSRTGKLRSWCKVCANVVAKKYYANRREKMKYYVKEYRKLIPEQQKKAFNYTNFQPLWATDNLAKGPKLGWLQPCKL